MIFDNSLLMSSQQAITADAASTNVIDLGATGTPFGGTQLVRDIGVGKEIELSVVVTETSDKDCDAKTVTTTTTTTTSGRTVYNEETNTWDPIEDLVVVTSSERPTTAEECPVTTTPTPTPNPSVTSTPVPAADGPDELAKTGYEGASLMPVFWSVLGVIVLGTVFLIGSFFWRRKHPVDATEV